MTVCVALLRGINVGGKNILPMQDLRNTLGELGCKDVKTYIQSGNAVLRSNADRKLLARKIKSAIDQQFSFAPSVHVLALAEFQSILSSNPFPAAVDSPKSIHIWFFSDVPEDPDLAALETLASRTERFKLSTQAFYLLAPDGIGRSKLAAKVDKCLGVETTARNWRTLTRIADLAAITIS